MLNNGHNTQKYIFSVKIQNCNLIFDTLPTPKKIRISKIKNSLLNSVIKISK